MSRDTVRARLCYSALLAGELWLWLTSVHGISEGFLIYLLELTPILLLLLQIWLLSNKLRFLFVALISVHVAMDIFVTGRTLAFGQFAPGFGPMSDFRLALPSRIVDAVVLTLVLLARVRKRPAPASGAAAVNSTNVVPSN